MRFLPDNANLLESTVKGIEKAMFSSKEGVGALIGTIDRLYDEHEIAVEEIRIGEPQDGLNQN